MTTKICRTRNMPKTDIPHQSSLSRKNLKRSKSLTQTKRYKLRCVERLPNHLKRLLFKIFMERFKSILLRLRILRSMLGNIKNDMIPCLLSQSKSISIDFLNIFKRVKC